MKALVGAFNQEKALVGAFSVIVKTDCGTDGSFYSAALTSTHKTGPPSLASLFCRKGMGSGLMARKRPLENIMRSMSTILSKPLTIKMRTGIYSDKVGCDWPVDPSTEL